VPSTPCHHVTLTPPHKGPLLGLWGKRWEARPRVPPGRRGVIVWDLHHHRPGAAGGCRPLRRLRRRLRPRLRSRGSLTRCRGHRFRPRPHDRGRPTALLSRRSGLRLHHRRHHGLRLHRDRRTPLLDGRRLWNDGPIRWPRPRGLSGALRALARRGRRAHSRPRCPQRAPPGGNGCVGPQHLGWCEGRHGRYHPA
jgi:hypothetical protein